MEHSGHGPHQLHVSKRNSFGAMQKPRFEQINAIFDLMALIVEDVGQNCVFEVLEHIERGTFHPSVLPFASEA